MTGYFRYYNRTVLGSGGWVLSKVSPINARKKLNIWLTTSKNRDDVLYSQKYLKILKSKKDARKYLIIFFNTPTRPELDPLLGIFSNNRSNNEKPYPLVILIPMNNPSLISNSTICRTFLHYSLFEANADISPHNIQFHNKTDSTAQVGVK